MIENTELENETWGWKRTENEKDSPFLQNFNKSLI